MSKSVLFISYAFPPVGGAGVQRVVKFVKYLPDFDWESTVLTVENPSVPVFDESMLQDIPATVAIYKAKTLEPGYKTKEAVSASTDTNSFNLSKVGKKILRQLVNFVLQPDPQILWLPAAAKVAKRILRSKKYDAIVATAPPFSSLLLGAYLAKKFNVPLLLDFRDEWDISNAVWENKNLDRVSLAIQRRMQNYVLKRASVVIATTELSVNVLREKVKHYSIPPRVRCIYNGYDAEDLDDLAPISMERGNKYVLSYVGTLWNLTSIAPIINAVLRIEKEYPELAKSIELVVAGRRTAEQEQLVEKLVGSSVVVTRHDYLSHRAALGLMSQSQGLCLLLSDIGFARRVVPAKIFEYLATKKSIFAIAPKGEVWTLLKDYPRGFCAEPSDLDSIVAFLVNDVRRFINQANSDSLDSELEYDSTRFGRRALTRELAELLDQITSHRHP